MLPLQQLTLDLLDLIRQLLCFELYVVVSAYLLLRIQLDTLTYHGYSILKCCDSLTHMIEDIRDFSG